MLPKVTQKKTNVCKELKNTSRYIIRNSQQFLVIETGVKYRKKPQLFPRHQDISTTVRKWSFGRMTIAKSNGSPLILFKE